MTADHLGREPRGGGWTPGSAAPCAPLPAAPPVLPHCCHAEHSHCPQHLRPLLTVTSMVSPLSGCLSRSFLPLHFLAHSCAGDRGHIRLGIEMLWRRCQPALLKGCRRLTSIPTQGAHLAVTAVGGLKEGHDVVLLHPRLGLVAEARKLRRAPGQGGGNVVSRHKKQVGAGVACMARAHPTILPRSRAA